MEGKRIIRRERQGCSQISMIGKGGWNNCKRGLKTEKIKIIQGLSVQDLCLSYKILSWFLCRKCKLRIDFFNSLINFILLLIFSLSHIASSKIEFSEDWPLSLFGYCITVSIGISQTNACKSCTSLNCSS